MKKLWLLILTICISCNTATHKAIIHISFTDSKTSLKITGIDPLIMNDINRDTVSAWQSLFAIYKLPADTNMKDYQPKQPGKYLLKDSILTFTPDTPFTKQQTYFLRYYNYEGNKTIWDYVKGKTRLGQLHYADLIFKQ